MSGTFGRILSSALVVDWSQFEGSAALRCTLGVAIPLIAGLAIGQPAVGVFAAVGAMRRAAFAGHRNRAPSRAAESGVADGGCPCGPVPTRRFKAASYARRSAASPSTSA